jgi:hypothetical protein
MDLAAQEKVTADECGLSFSPFPLFYFLHEVTHDM